MTFSAGCVELLRRSENDASRNVLTEIYIESSFNIKQSQTCAINRSIVTNSNAPENTYHLP